MIQFLLGERRPFEEPITLASFGAEMMRGLASLLAVGGIVLGFAFAGGLL